LEIGLEECDAEKNLKDTITLLLATPEAGDNTELLAKVNSFAFADERFEALAPIQKLLLRMGPDNGKKIRAKLGELKSIL
jgi:hypothetical protein